ncbi:VWA domain-containing protein [Peteryoungia ipomoeae]|nr:VWA domain-containing protein [Peteryoungia ipomoeae]
MAELGPHDAFLRALDSKGAASWADALLVIDLLGLGGSALGGVWLKARAGGVRDLFLTRLQARLGPDVRWTRLPPGSAILNLTGGIDLAATAATGRLQRQQGLLALAQGGVLMVSMAERLDPSLAAMVATAMDDASSPGFLLVAIDESLEDEAALSQTLGDRLALRIDLDGIGWHHVGGEAPSVARGAPTVDAWRGIDIDDRLLKGLASLAELAGHRSPRMLSHLARTARLFALHEGRPAVEEADALTALRLCLGISIAPQSTTAETENNEPPPPPSGDAGSASETATSNSDVHDDCSAEAQPTKLDALTDLLAAVQAGSLVADPWLSVSQRPSRNAGSVGKSGSLAKNARRGRPYGIGLSPPYAQARPDIVATLRAAAPFQRIRAAQRATLVAATLPSTPCGMANGSGSPRAFVSREDFRYVRLRHAAPSTAIFIVDASGSTALERLGETKGAIESLLARCYIRRDEVALVAFHGTGAELLLAPTRSLTAAKRTLAALPGGGPTPLAAGLKAGLELAISVERRGSTPILVLLTDGSGNIALDGRPDRAVAAEEVQRLATNCRMHAFKTICIDIARRPRDSVANLSRLLGADLHILRRADAGRISHLVDRSMQEAQA